jgi:hypothetical protein
VWVSWKKIIVCGQHKKITKCPNNTILIGCAVFTEIGNSIHTFMCKSHMADFYAKIYTNKCLHEKIYFKFFWNFEIAFFRIFNIGCMPRCKSSTSLISVIQQEQRLAPFVFFNLMVWCRYGGCGAPNGLVPGNDGVRLNPSQWPDCVLGFQFVVLFVKIWGPVCSFYVVHCPVLCSMLFTINRASGPSEPFLEHLQ